MKSVGNCLYLKNMVEAITNIGKLTAGLSFDFREIKANECVKIPTVQLRMSNNHRTHIILTNTDKTLYLSYCERMDTDINKWVSDNYFCSLDSTKGDFPDFINGLYSELSGKKCNCGIVDEHRIFSDVFVGLFCMYDVDWSEIDTPDCRNAYGFRVAFSENAPYFEVMLNKDCDIEIQTKFGDKYLCYTYHCSNRFQMIEAIFDLFDDIMSAEGDIIKIFSPNENMGTLYGKDALSAIAAQQSKTTSDHDTAVDNSSDEDIHPEETSHEDTPKDDDNLLSLETINNMMSAIVDWTQNKKCYIVPFIAVPSIGMWVFSHKSSNAGITITRCGERQYSIYKGAFKNGCKESCEEKCYIYNVTDFIRNILNPILELNRIAENEEFYQQFIESL